MKLNRARRNWLLPVLLAMVLGTALLALGARMLRNQESAIERELTVAAGEAAKALPRNVEVALLEDRDFFAPGITLRREPPVDECPVSFRIARASLTAGNADPPAAPRAEPAEKGCAELGATLPLVPIAARADASEAFVRRCPTARGTLGTPLSAGILVERHDGPGLARWLGAYRQELTSEDRRSLRTAIADAHFPRETQASLLALLRSKGPEAVSRDRTLVARLRATEDSGTAGTPLRGETTLAVALSGTLARPAMVTILDPDELVRCAGVRLPLPPDLRLQLLDPSERDRATTTRLAPELLLEVVPRGPEVIRTRTQHARFVLGGLFGLTVVLLGALVGFGAFRTRRAEELAELRTDFAAAIAHELRTPLTSMRILTELLAENSLSDEDRRLAATSLLEQTKRLSSTAERMLTLRSLMVGKATPRKRSVALAALVEEAILDLQTRAPEITVRLSLPEDAVANSDPALLRVIVDNLMDNALKYAGGPRAVDITELGNAWEIAIRDEGPGVPDAAKERLFEPFERAAAKLSETQGAGLGLAIVRYAAEAMGASVGVRDATPKGAIFFIRVPKYDAKQTTSSQSNSEEP